MEEDVKRTLHDDVWQGKGCLTQHFGPCAPCRSAWTGKLQYIIVNLPLTSFLDHIAVNLYLTDEVGELTLHLPTWLCTDGQTQFYDNGLKDWKTNPSHTAHKLLDKETLHHLTLAETVGAKLCVQSGFHERNTYVAASDYLLAFTWGSGWCRNRRWYHGYVEEMWRSEVSRITCVSPRKRKKTNRIACCFTN